MTLQVKANDAWSPVGGGTTPWTRPAEWLPMPTMTEDEYFVGLVAVWPDSSKNWVRILASGNDPVEGKNFTYTINWGDGNVYTNWDINNPDPLAVYQHQYDYADLSPSSETSDGYRQAIVTIVPDTSPEALAAGGGGPLNYLNLQQQAVDSTPNQEATQTNDGLWLDIEIDAPHGTEIYIGAIDLVTDQGSFVGSTAVHMTMLERVVIRSTDPVGIGQGSLPLLANCTALRYFSMPALTQASSYMFYNCVSLTDVHIDDWSEIYYAAGMFDSCLSLVTVDIPEPQAPLTDYNFEGTAMFRNCASLTSLPGFEWFLLMGYANMFYGCSSLISLPNPIQGDSWNGASTSGMFQNCSSLVSVPEFGMWAVLNASSMFQGCTSLVEVPAFDCYSVTNMTSMFQGCVSLVDAPALKLEKVTNLTSMFQGCTSLRRCTALTYSTPPDQNNALGGTENVTTITNMFSGCTALEEVDLLLPSVTTAATPLPASNIYRTSLKSVSLTGMKVAFSVGGSLMTSAELNSMYAQLPSLLSATITGASSVSEAYASNVTFTTSAPHKYIVGQKVTVAGVNPTSYNGTWLIHDVPDDTHFKVRIFASVGNYVSGGSIASVGAKTVTISGSSGRNSDDPTIATAKGWTVGG